MKVREYKAKNILRFLYGENVEFVSNIFTDGIDVVFFIESLEEPLHAQRIKFAKKYGIFPDDKMPNLWRDQYQNEYIFVVKYVYI